MRRVARRTFPVLAILVSTLCPGCSGTRDTGNRTAESPCVAPRDCSSETDCSARCECQGGSIDHCTAACNASLALDDMTKVLELVNAERAKGGCCDSECFGPLPPLEANVLLAYAAQLHAADMAANDYLSHTSMDGRDPFDRMSDAGFSGCAMAENIARSFSDPAAVVNGWLASHEHCINLYWDRVRFMGIGHAVAPESLGSDDFWAQDFGG